jgi:hypothetical protein
MCIELFVLFKFLNYYVYEDIFHLTFMGNNFTKIGAIFCNYWNCHKDD